MGCIAKAALLFFAGTFAALANDSEQCDKITADPDEGIPACTRLIESSAKGTNLAAVYYNRGIGWYRKGLYNNAIKDFTQAIDLDPKYTLAYLGRADSWNSKKKSDQALADLDKVITLAPNQPTGYNDRAMVWMDKGAFDQAIADLDRAISIDANNWRSYSSRGE